VCQFVRRVAVGREKQDALGHVIEAADVGQPRHIGDKLEDRPTSTRITAGGEYARRLVENDPAERRRCADGFAIDRDCVPRRVYALAGLSDGSIDADTASGDQFFCLATRGDSRARQRALNPH